MLVRVQRKGNPLRLLAGMRTGAVTVENSMEVPQKAKNRTTIQQLPCQVFTQRIQKYRFEGVHAPQCL